MPFDNIEYEIWISKSKIGVTLADQQVFSFEKIKLPEEFIQWQARSRIQLFNTLRTADASTIKQQPAHLPVLASLGSPPFSINLATRGLGLIPSEKYLDEFITQFEDGIEENKDKPWKDSIIKRVDIAQRFYENQDHFDQWIVGGLDIFEGKTFRNLLRDPLASLLYTGGAPDFLSYQFNGVIQMVDQYDPRCRFLLAARKLFAFDPFHVPQSSYAGGYIFHLIEIINKTPFSRK